MAWLERFLDEYAGTVLAVTHDRYFLDNVAGWILELDRGHGIPFQGNYSSWLEQKQARLAVEEKQESARRRTLQRELEWVRMAPRARHAKSRARVAAYEQLLAEDAAVKLDTVEIHIPAGPRLGDVVVEADGLRKGYGDRLLIDGLDFSLPAGGIVGVIGPNGAGKTTLFRMIAGQEEPDGGELRLGPSVQLAYVDQARADLDPANTVWKEISAGKDRITVGTREIASRAYVASFNFRGGDQQKRVSATSPAASATGSTWPSCCARAATCCCWTSRPTTSTSTRCARSRRRCSSFAGCAVVITHDRWFLDRVATHILAFEGDSEVVWFEGAYDEYEENRHAPARRRGRPAAPDQVQAARPAVGSGRLDARCQALHAYRFRPTRRTCAGSMRRQKSSSWQPATNSPAGRGGSRAANARSFARNGSAVPQLIETAVCASRRRRRRRRFGRSRPRRRTRRAPPRAAGRRSARSPRSRRPPTGTAPGAARRRAAPRTRPSTSP